MSGYAGEACLYRSFMPVVFLFAFKGTPPEIMQKVTGRSKAGKGLNPLETAYWTGRIDVLIAKYAAQRKSIKTGSSAPIFLQTAWGRKQATLFEACPLCSAIADMATKDLVRQS